MNTKCNQNNIETIAGDVVGIVTYIIWVLLFISIGNYSGQSDWLHNPIVIWLMYGTIPLFISAGRFLMSMNVSKKDENFKDYTPHMKLIFDGFIMWLLVVVVSVLFFQVKISTEVNITLGFLFILAKYLNAEINFEK